MDYDSNPIMATFTAGSTSAMVNVLVTVDNIIEILEILHLSFTIPSSLQGQVMPGAITTAIAIITDDTSKEIMLGSVNLLHLFVISYYGEV